MKKTKFSKNSRLLTLAIVFSMMIVAVLPLASITASADSGSSSTIVTTPGVSENQRYFKEDTSYDMSEKINAPMTIEFELTGCTHIAGAAKGGVIFGNYSEDASSYINIEAKDYGQIIVNGSHNGSSWTATFYQSEADIRAGGVTHYTITIGTGWTGVSLYVNGTHKATRYPASITLPKASEFTNPFRIGGDYRSGNTNYFKGLINSVALFNDIRTSSEINEDKASAKTWSSSTSGLVAAYDITKMGEAALRDYSGNGNKLIYNNKSGIQVENFGKYEIEGIPGTSFETFEAWVYMPDYYSGVIGGTILGNYRSYNGARLFYEIYKDGTPRFSYTNADGKNVYHRFTDVDLRTGTWQHLAIVHDLASGEARCYVNGELKQTISDGSVAAYSNSILDQDFLIGRDTALRYAEGDGQYWDDRNDQYFKGFIKEIRVYSDVRSGDEIAADYTGSLDLTDGELLACYQIAPENAYSNIIDLSGNGYDAEYKQLLWEKEYIEPVTDYAYSFAIVGDTQTVTQQNPELLKNIYQWIIDNKDSMNIQYVIGLGDITEYGVDVGHSNYDESRANKQWQDAKAAITMMDGILPYSLIRGDGHDGIELFNQYFGSHAGYTENITGYMVEGRIDNVYHTFRVGEVDYMLLCLDHGTKDEVIEWANEVVAAHPNHRVIVTTHHYMQSDGTLSESGETGNATAYDPNNNAADVLWNEFIKKHPNIRMVMCGHSDSEEVLVRKQTGDHGNEVTEILINPQGMDAEYYHGSKGMVAMFHFSEDGQDVQVEYYSTIKGTYRPAESFTVDVSDKSHSYDAVVTKPTCTEDGYTTYTCTVCSDSYVDNETDALGHTEHYIEAKDPTCTETGLSSGSKCSVCGAILTPQEEIPAKGHFEVVIPGVAPTCTEKGLTDGLGCTNCDTVLTAQTEIPALGHNYACTETFAPTCIEKGTKIYTCQNDASHTYTEKIDALGHSYESVVTAPTCTENGYTTYTCKVCSDSYVDNTTTALGHTEEVIGGKAPTCTETGLTDGKRCTVCGTITTEQSEIPALGHSYEAVVTAPTCTEGGYTTYTCKVCSYSYVDNVIDALGHSYESVVTAPTCTEEGYTTYTCKVCYYSYVGDTTTALGHTEEVINGKAPTCTESGLTEGKRCTVCGTITTKQTVIQASGHIDAEPKDYTCDVCNADLCTDHNEFTVVGKAPTCTETGLTDGVICSICGDIILAQSEIPALGHSYESVVTAPTCTEDGYTTYTCKVCSDSYVDNTTAALGHTEEILDAKAPTCTETGLTEGKKCTVCGVIIVEQTEIPELGHTEETLNAKAPTCTETGLTEGKQCTVCGVIIVEQTEIPELGHTEETLDAKAHTCTESGLTEGKQCTVCGVIIVEQTEIPALGHTEETLNAKAPTCTESGLTEGKKCTACGVIIVEQTEIPALGHTEEILNAKAPTCTETGLTEGKKCTVCGTITTEQSEIPALGHSYESIVTVPTCTEGGYTTYTCTVCSDSYVDDVTEARGHYENTIRGKAPTCTEVGYTDCKICTACGTYTVERAEIPALGHVGGDAVIRNEVKPDCENNGHYDSVTYCTVCNKEASRETVTVDALGHAWIDATTEAPKTCDRCGKTDGEKLPTPDVEPDVEPDEPTDDPIVEKDHTECKAANVIEMIINMIVNFIRELLGLPKQCICGDEL